MGEIYRFLADEAGAALQNVVAERKHSRGIDCLGVKRTTSFEGNISSEDLVGLRRSKSISNFSRGEGKGNSLGNVFCVGIHHASGRKVF